MFGSEMEACVALVIVVRVLEGGRVIVHDALHQGEVVGDNGASEARVHFDPGYIYEMLLWIDECTGTYIVAAW